MQSSTPTTRLPSRRSFCTLEVREVVRTRDEKIIETGDFVVDGRRYDAKRNRFDHHQTGGAGFRENGIPYAAFGLVWKEFGSALSGLRGNCGARRRIACAADRCRRQWVALGKYGEKPPFPYFIQNAISVFAPAWNETEFSFDDGFAHARQFASDILNEIAYARAALLGEERARCIRCGRRQRIIVLTTKRMGQCAHGKTRAALLSSTPTQAQRSIGGRIRCQYRHYRLRRAALSLARGRVSAMQNLRHCRA